MASCGELMSKVSFADRLLDRPTGCAAHNPIGINQPSHVVTDRFFSSLPEIPGRIVPPTLPSTTVVAG
eukprot:1188838-Prorocentrum_minimum.AAC.5